MACSDGWLEVLSACHDGEASPEEASRASAHLAGCAECESTVRDFQRIRAAFRGAPLATRPRRSVRPSVRMVGATALLAAAVAGILWWNGVHPASGLARELEARHLMAFSRSPACEFHSADPAAVARWLEENVGYEVTVPSIPDAELLGARRCPLRGGMTASVLYRRDGEAVTLFLPRTGSVVAQETARLARKDGGCTAGPLGLTVCAQPGRVVTAETRETALLALQSR